MRIIHRRINKKTRVGEVVLVPYTEDDIWYIYNLLVAGDVIRTQADRKVKKQEGEFGVTKIQRKTLTLTMIVLSVSFQSDDKGTSLIVKTKNLSENEFVTIGQVQSTEIKLTQKLSIVKEHWSNRDFNLLDEASTVKETSDSLVILFDDGYASFFFLKNNFTKFYSKIVQSIPRKKGGMAEIYKKRVDEFDRKVWEYLLKQIDVSSLRLIVIAGPGTAKKRFHDKLLSFSSHCSDQELQKKMQENIKKTLVINVSSVIKTALDEVLKNPKIMEVLEDTRAVKEMRKLDEFFTILEKNPNCAVYGIDEVEYACNEGAIKCLMITDGLLRSHDFTKRKRMSKLVDNCASQGAEVFEFHENHSSGQKLKEITGVTAILRYAIQMDLDFDHGEDDEEVEEDEAKIELKIQGQELNDLLRQGADEDLFNDDIM